MCFDHVFAFFFFFPRGTHLTSIVSSSVTGNTSSAPVSNADLIFFFFWGLKLNN